MEDLNKCTKQLEEMQLYADIFISLHLIGVISLGCTLDFGMQLMYTT